MSVVREHLHRMPFRKPPWERSMLGREGSVGKSTYAQAYGPSLHLQHPWKMGEMGSQAHRADGLPFGRFFKGKPCFLILNFK